MSHSFKVSLEKGRLGENFLIANMEGMRALDGRRGDLLTPEGYIMEVKTDGYDMAKTKNFFIERWSDIIKGKPGGPWQSKEHGVDLFAYLYIKNATVFIFKLDSLLTALEPLVADMKLIDIQNKSWLTQGYLIDRSLLKGVYEQRKF